MSTDRGRPLRETSFGGVVLRGDDVLVITPTGKRRVTGLPKGGANLGETPEQTAAREVREETGVTASVRGPLGDVNYWYRRGGRRVYKTVHFFLCDYVSGSPRTTTTRSRTRAGSRSPKRAPRSAIPASGH